MFKVYELSSIYKDSHIENLYKESTIDKDIFFDLNYLFVNDFHESGTTKIAIKFKNDSIGIIFPFVEREIFESEYKDIITPYEYGGILVLDENCLDNFYIEFQKFCYENKIVTGFFRLNPFIEHNVFNKELSTENIYIDLKNSEETIFLNYHKNNRRDIRYAKRNNVKVVFEDPNEKNIEQFKSLYISTMDSKNASSIYYFNDSYFKKLILLKNNLKVGIAFDAEDNMLSSALFIYKSRYCHYHLSGANREFTKLCGTNLLLHEAIIKFKTLGISFLHLGGASKSQLGLYSFKSKFSKERIKYFVSKSIFNEYLYNSLNNQYKKDITEVENSFFPIYRCP